MAANPRSHALTSAYRERLLAITGRVERETARRWPTIENFDREAEEWVDSTAALVAGAQREAVRATAGYLSAYLTSELGRRTQGPPLDSRSYEGSRDGRPLGEALRSPIIGVRGALKDGKSAAEALQVGLNRALRTVELDTMQASRRALQDAMEADEHVQGWQRAVRGTCGACAGDIATEVSVNLPSLPLNIHPNCKCVTQPVVSMRGVPVNPQGRLAEAAAPALNALRRHRWSRSDTPRESIPIREVDGPDEFINTGIFPTEIRLRAGQSATETNTSLAHEAGHYLDNIMVDRTDLDNLSAKFLSNRPTSEMRSFLRQAKKKKLPRGYDDPNELWARAYAQWQGFPETDVGIAWTADEFKPVAEALERVLRAQGFLD